MTDIINLEDLPFPMFKTTEGEKEELREALSGIIMLPSHSSNYFLCHHVRSQSLLSKIRCLITDDLYTLSDYLDFKVGGNFFCNEATYEFNKELRATWINKLLAYKGDQ